MMHGKPGVVEAESLLPGRQQHEPSRGHGRSRLRAFDRRSRYNFFPCIALANTLTAVVIATLIWTSCAEPGKRSSLPDLALQHVLADASQIFGDSAAPPNKTGTPATWMSRHADSTPITHLSIPGAHDVATWNFSVSTRDLLPPDANTRDPAYFRTQRRSIVCALEAGVRFFDLRYALDPTGTTLVFWHHEALLSEVARVADVMFAFYAWLEKHDSETVLLSFQYEGGTVPGAANDAHVQGLLVDVLTSPAARRYILQSKGRLGTLGDARGKIILLRRFDLDRLPPEYEAAMPGIHLAPGSWPDNGPDFKLVYNTEENLAAYIEDYYEPNDLPIGLNTSVNIAKKLDAVTAHLRKAATEEPESLFITFASGEHNDNVPPVFPEIMALGNGTVDTPLGGVNQQLLPVLKELKGKRLGVVALDYWDEPAGLVGAILGLQSERGTFGRLEDHWVSRLFHT